jgi:SOS-response transcriptional repressor LexA
MRAELTKSQSKVMTYLRSYIGEHGMSPTYTDIANHFGFNPGNAYQTIEILARKGYVNRIKGVCRGLTLTDHADILLPDINDEEYWYDGVFKPQLYQRDVVEAIKSAGMKVKEPS